MKKVLLVMEMPDDKSNDEVEGYLEGFDDELEWTGGSIRRFEDGDADVLEAATGANPGDFRRGFVSACVLVMCAWVVGRAAGLIVLAW